MITPHPQQAEATASPDPAGGPAGSGRLEALGRLTGSVAHDFNNMLTAVIGALEALTLLHPEDTEGRELAAAGLHAAERGSELVRRLLAFSREDAAESQNIECARLLEALRGLLRGALPEAVVLELAASPEALDCIADRAELESALLNLCLNARDAMPAGGRLTVRAEAAHLDAGTAAGLGLRPGAYARFLVADTGVGMSGATLRRALEPFFTTKGQGGCGLGLSTAHAFARQSGGRLLIESEQDRGTTVTLLLPRGRALTQAHLPLPPPRADLAGRSVLLVDDDEAAREHAARLLRELGCEVRIAAEASATLSLQPESLDADLLIADLGGGAGEAARRLAERVRRIQPDLRVLYTSARPAALDEMGQRHISGHFLPKPYRRVQFAEAVTAALAPAAAPHARRSGRRA
jgi:CheY-like chemotaxis protein